MTDVLTKDKQFIHLTSLICSMFTDKLGGIELPPPLPINIKIKENPELFAIIYTIPENKNQSYTSFYKI